MWDPDQYLAFDDHRGRPFHELIARVGARSPRTVVDLGCGPGNLTRTLRDRWPDATVIGYDSSPEMVAASAEYDVTVRLGDIATWRPRADTDVVVSNAALQWVPGHVDLLRAWVRDLPPGAWLAVQVPGNFGAPSHEAVREVARSPRWRARLADAGLRGEDAVLDPAGYADVLADAGCAVDAWETTYQQRLTGRDPVLRWITGTALRPIQAVLTEPEWAEFRATLIPLLERSYPRRQDGTTWFPFRRVFVVARTTPA